MVITPDSYGMLSPDISSQTSSLCSGGTFPYDDGSKQEIKNSLFVGESGNVGTEMMDNRIWGPGGLDHSGRTLPIGQ